MHLFYKKKGFALITALLFIGFLFTLIITISALLRIDFHLIEKTLIDKEAKANAIIGMKLALADLQKNLGPDIPRTMSFDKHGEILNRRGEELGYYNYTIEDLTLSEDYKNALGVLSDPENGGLKQNLTSYFLENKGLKDEEPIIENRSFSPKWGILKSFYKICKERKTNSINPIAIHKSELLDRKYKGISHETKDPITVTHSVGPLITRIQFGLRPILHRDENAGFSRNMDIRYFLTLELWNPYDCELNDEEYLFEISSKKIDDRTIDTHYEDNILYLNENQKCRLNCERSNINIMHNAIFRGFIKCGFKSGETKSFVLSSTENKFDIKIGNRLIECADKNNFVMDTINQPLQGGGRVDHDRPNYSSKEKKTEEKNQNMPPEQEIPNMRGGGKAPPRFKKAKRKEESKPKPQDQAKQQSRNVQAISSIQWGGRRVPEYSFSLTLKRDPQFIFQEIKELKVDGCRLIQNPDIINNVSEEPLISFIFENIITKKNLEKFNPRSPIIWINDNNIIKTNNNYPYKCEFFLGNFIKNNNFDNTTIFHFPKIFKSLSIFHHCNIGLHENNPSAVCGNSFKNVYIETNIISYLYDLTYYVNKALWDSYFLMEDKERFFKLKSGQVLLREPFNINSTSRPHWLELLLGLRNPHYNLKKPSIEQLAKEVVKGIETRGPFKTVSEFINRSFDGKNECGLMQEALNKAGIDLYQYDILDLIGDKLTVRSDTFLIRAYGGKKKGKRNCCEAIVQRVPEYMDIYNEPEDSYEKLTSVNKQFGRRFKITSFRWLQ